ncbi:ketopantoate reductase family protein [Legionella impletisoli]|uniref:2-dehydropantoate 2-reductase n=1 Tax=Legionella impletisoli TaxID=343510 RepID=A0A917N7Y5_9GAMM|nr:2-dehydropantoate 2-reductase [Legionella impletisoli]GGI75226.1 putative 2-dehydropantoate 2-reductase [Legionella impletisoli]
MGKKNNWWVAGIGAMGTLIACKLHQSGQEVTLLLKDQTQLDRYSGLRFCSIDTTYSCRPRANIVSNLHETSIQQLILCCKAYDIVPLLRQIRPFLAENALVVMIHNGIGVLEEIKAFLPDLRLVLGISTLGAYLEQPFKIKACMGGQLQLGILNGHFTFTETEAIKASFEQTKLTIQWQNDIKPFMWKKFAINCAINMFTAIYQCKNGDLLSRPEEIRKQCDEIALVLNAYEVEITSDGLFQTVMQVIRQTAANYSSMYTDAVNGKKTELNYLNEQLVRLAKAKYLPTPFSSALIAQFYRVYKPELEAKVNGLSI